MLRLALIFLVSLIAPAAALAETVIAAGTIRSHQVIGPTDVALAEGEVPGALLRLEDAIGLEARINLYPGRPVRPGDLQPPAVIERNEVVTLQYSAGGLMILTEGRALDRGGLGDRLRVQNLASRTTVSGTVLGPGVVRVGPAHAEAAE